MTYLALGLIRLVIFYMFDIVPSFWLRRLHWYSQDAMDSEGREAAYYLRGRKVAEVRMDGTLDFWFED